MSTDAVEIIETNGQRSRSLFTRPSLRGDDDERKKDGMKRKGLPQSEWPSVAVETWFVKKKAESRGWGSLTMTEVPSPSSVRCQKSLESGVMLLWTTSLRCNRGTILVI